MSAAATAELPVVGRRSPEIERLVEAIDEWLATASGDGFVVVNALGPRGSLAPRRVRELVRTAREQQPGRSVLVVLDEESPGAVRAARDAGANEFLGRDELENEEAVLWRLWNASVLSLAEHAAGPVERSARAEARPLSIGQGVHLTSEQAERAGKTIDAAVATLPTAEERRSLGTGLLEVVAPELRDAESGRLDARRIADAMGMSLAALARASGVSQQALSAKPDSPGAQAGLLPVAELSEMLDEMFTPEHKRAWLRTPHPRFGDRTPLQAIEAGDAELVALSVAGALEGLPD